MKIPLAVAAQTRRRFIVARQTHRNNRSLATKE
jgi:hypothetical protein